MTLTKRLSEGTGADRELEWDDHGYPTDESVEAMFSYEGETGWTKFGPIIARLPEIMKPCPYADVSAKWVDEHIRKELEVTFITGGWSGAETVINALLAVRPIKVLYYYKWQRGGLHVFRVPEKQTGRAALISAHEAGEG